MKLKIYKLSSPQFHVETFREFLQSEGQVWSQTNGAAASEELVEAAGRICYMSFGEKQFPRSNRDYIRNLIRQGHESVLEHVSWTFLLAGVSRACTHQLVRHRAGFSFSQLSQQYHEESDATFIEPMNLQQSPRALEAWRNATSVARESYKVILDSLRTTPNGSEVELKEKELKRAIQSAARSVLPNATETKIVVTANAHALRHFFRVRGSIPGDAEMREVAGAIFTLANADAPALFADFVLTSLADHTPLLTHDPTG